MKILAADEAMKSGFTKWKKFCVFVCACISGTLFALVYQKYQEAVHQTLVHSHYFPALRDSGYETWMVQNSYRQKRLAEEDISYAKIKPPDIEAVVLSSKVPVLCIVLTRNKNKASAIKDTWAKHCNGVLFFGTYTDKGLPVIKVPRLMTIEGFTLVSRYVRKRQEKNPNSPEPHWFLVTDDDTYGLVENLRYYVAPLNFSHPYYLGHAAKDYSRIYNEGDAGIVLSRKAMDILMSSFDSEEALPRRTLAPSTHYDEGIGVLLNRAGVIPFDTRDLLGKSRFIPFSPEQMLIPGSISIFSSYWRRSMFLSSEGSNCCSDHAITFHGISPSQMFLMEYLLHHLAPFRYSPNGLGNHPPTVQHGEPDPKDNMIFQGIPYVKPLDLKTPKKKHKKAKTNKDSTDDVENSILPKVIKEFFGN